MARKKRQRRPAQSRTSSSAAATVADVDVMDPLERVAQALRAERAAAADREVAVLEARAAGATWTEIARVLGVSPQAVQQRYSGSLIP